jgi:hypothetical protein
MVTEGVQPCQASAGCENLRRIAERAENIGRVLREARWEQVYSGQTS